LDHLGGQHRAAGERPGELRRARGERQDVVRGAAVVVGERPRGRLLQGHARGAPEGAHGGFEAALESPAEHRAAEPRRPAPVAEPAAHQVDGALGVAARHG
jgi:hypothetical protein